MYIQLKDNTRIEILSYSPTSFTAVFDTKTFEKTFAVLTVQNLRSALVVEDDDKTTTELRNLKLKNILINVDADPSIVGYMFDVIPDDTLALEAERQEREAIQNIIYLGLNQAPPEDVIKWVKYLPKWNEFKFPYKKGERFKHNDIAYECVSDHSSESRKKPDNSPERYKKVTKEVEKPTYKEWKKGDVCNEGDIVLYNGLLWQCTWNNNSREPSAYALGWKKYDPNS